MSLGCTISDLKSVLNLCRTWWKQCLQLPVWLWVLFWPSYCDFLGPSLLPYAPLWVSCPLTLVLLGLGLQYWTLNLPHTDYHSSGSWLMACHCLMWPPSLILSCNLFLAILNPPSVLDWIILDLPLDIYNCGVPWEKHIFPLCFHFQTLFPIKASYCSQTPSPHCLLSMPHLHKKVISGSGTSADKGMEVRMWKTWLGSLWRPIWLG